MTRQERLKRLRDMIAQLERLPATPERDRMLREVRARVVDVDSGIQPGAFPAADVESILADSLAARTRKPAAERRRPRAIQPPQPAKPVVDVAPSVEFETDVVLNFDDFGSYWPDEADEAPARAWTRGLRG